jgi:hypothetical protein
MIQIHSRRRFFPLSNQCVTMRSQLGLLLHFTDNADKICGFAWIFKARTEIAKFRGVTVGQDAVGPAETESMPTARTLQDQELMA